MTAHEIAKSVFATTISMTYHAVLLILGVKQYAKLYDCKIALLAIIAHACPSHRLVDESVSTAVREKHGNQLYKIEAGEEGYEDLFIYIRRVPSSLRPTCTIRPTSSRSTIS